MNPLEGMALLAHISGTAERRGLFRAAGGGSAFRMPGHRRPPSDRSDCEIREAVPADVLALMRLEAERFASDRLSRRSFAALIRSASAVVLVGDRNRALAGYAVLLTRRGGQSARLYSIAVADAETGRGTGTSLLQAVEEAARRRGIARVNLEVRADNPGAIGLYERAGYTAVGRRDGYYEDGMAALIYARGLAILSTRPADARRLPRAA